MRPHCVCLSPLVLAAVLAGAGCSRKENAAPASPVTAKVLSAADQPTTAPQSPSLGVERREPWENSLGMKFVPVPGTNVLFSIWETRVQDFEAFVKATSYNAGEGWRDPGGIKASGRSDVAGFSQTPLHPVVNVSWNDAEAFGRWLTEKERAAGNLSAGQEFRLPTDAEWSRAVGLSAEPGATPQDKDRKIQNVYPWGAGFPPPQGSGNYSGEGDGFPWKIDRYTDGAKFSAKVGSYTANRFGIHDLGGNVWEWSSDWYNADRKERAVRGASFNQSSIDFLLSSLRTRNAPGTREFNLGFRVVVTVSASSHDESVR
jgi:formylglycine-generating enzyme required for sulfatase activity